MTPERESPAAYTVLLVEDDDAAAYLVQIAFTATMRHAQLFRVANGDHALEFLSRTGAYAQAPAADFMILDLNMPGKSGLEVMQIVRATPETAAIRVAVLSCSDAPQDRASAFALGADCYFVKGDLDSIAEAVDCVCRMLRESE